MANTKLYEVQGTANTVYIDKSGQAINGYNVRVLAIEFDEVHVIQVTSLAPDVVKAAIESLLANRRALADLG
jgi:hypothetical protein